MRTPGKLIILGEYAVLEGGYCLVTATNRYANAIFKNLKMDILLFKHQQ